MLANVAVDLNAAWKAKRFRGFSRQKHDKATAQAYKFLKIKPDQEIRLFQFQTTDSQEDIHIEIGVARIDIDNPKDYYCISYVWGDPKDPKNLRKIYCDGKAITITLNLFEALTQLRKKLEKKKLWFWADQITIDQTNLKEKSAQVAMMSRIFPKAERVICWLGKEDGYTATAYSVIQNWEKAEKDADLRLELNRSWSAVSSQKSSQQLDQEAALSTFFSQEWFQRTWTLQEVFVPSKKVPLVVCGSLDIDWNTVCAAFLVLVTTLSLDDACKVLGDKIAGACSMFGIYIGRGESTIQFSALLFGAAKFREAGDPKDKIFALLGIMQYEGFAYPKPDYDLSEKQVFLKYTREIIEQEESLDVLSYGRSRWSSEDNMPSWVFSPQRIEASERPFFHTLQERSGFPDGGATGKTKPLLKSIHSEFDHELQLYGLRLDHIVRVQKLQNVLSESLGSKKRWQDVNAAIHDLARCLDLRPRYGYTDEDSVVAYMKTLVADDFYVCPARPTRDYRNETTRLFNKFLREHSERMDLITVEEDEEHRAIPWTEDSLHKVAQHHFQFDAFTADRRTANITQPFRVSPSDPRLTDWLDKTVTQDLIRTIQRYTFNVNLALTATGLLALVPGATTVGDELCLLMGGLLPFVLCPANDGKYLLVGGAYVHGLMDGGSARQCEDLYQKAAGGDLSGLTKFCLV